MTASVIARRVIERTSADLAEAVFGQCTGRLWSPVTQDPFIWVSEDGEAVSLYRKKAKRLKPVLSGAYHAVNVGPRYTTTHIHRLIAETFLGPCPFPGAQVRHKDGNRFNNRLSNLCWGTARENAADKIGHGTHNAGERNPQAKLTREAVAQMRKLRSDGMTFKDIANEFGVAAMTAHRAITGGSWK